MIDRIQRKDRGCGIAVDIDVYACVSVDSCVYSRSEHIICVK